MSLYLLDLLSPQHHSTSCSTEAQDWQNLLTIARQHRLLPLLHHRLEHRNDLNIPDDVRQTAKQAFKQYSMRALQQQRDLLHIQTLLNGAGIKAVPLKGFYLAHMVYPHPALRPLRDLDILVPHESALAAFDCLLANGYQRLPKQPGDPAFQLAHTKHLPGLRSPHGGIVELHARFSTPEHHGEQQQDFTGDPAVWARLVTCQMAGQTLHFFSPTDLLLHLIFHAVYDHYFDNGPLIISDIGFLLHKESIDWPLFWSTANQYNWTKGCQLMLATVHHFHPLPQEAVTPDIASIHQNMIDEVGNLMMRNFLETRDVEVQLAAQQNIWRGDSWLTACQHLFKVLFPNRQWVASCYGANPDSPTIIYWYLYRLWQRGRSYIKGRLNPNIHSNAQQIAHVIQWLKTDP